jgi:hypothetical protein
MAQVSKEAFLQQGALLYQRMIELAPSDTIRRYLAFRIIVNAMPFEDLVNNRQHVRMREIRDVFLAHKQEPDFFEGFRAVDEVRNATIQPLIDMMTASVGILATTDALPEINDARVSAGFSRVAPEPTVRRSATWP